MDYSKGTNKIHYIDETLGVVGATLKVWLSYFVMCKNYTALNARINMFSVFL